jgi:hypothetical protein
MRIAGTPMRTEVSDAARLASSGLRFWARAVAATAPRRRREVRVRDLAGIMDGLR